MEGAPAHGTVAHLLPPAYKRMIASWLEEDTPSLDYSGFVVGEDAAEAKLLGKSKVSTLKSICLLPGAGLSQLPKFTKSLANNFLTPPSKFPFLHFNVASIFHIAYYFHLYAITDLTIFRAS
jgi:hypothetical protein